MVQILQTEIFRNWRVKLRDDRAKALIASRLDRLAAGNMGDAKGVGGGVSELRIHYGPGYRLYIQRRGKVIIVLLCGGDKGSQERDIKLAMKLAEEWSVNDG